MHKQLEDYLAQVTRQIGSIPKPRRDEELKEMRAHLVSAVTANQELGQSEDVAVANALDDFGTPVEAALNVVRAWRCFAWKHGVKTFCTVVGIWSVFYVFQIVFMSPKVADLRLWFYGWAFTIVMSVLLILGPHYLASQSDYRRLVSMQRRR